MTKNIHLHNAEICEIWIWAPNAFGVAAIGVIYNQDNQASATGTYSDDDYNVYLESPNYLNTASVPAATNIIGDGEVTISLYFDFNDDSYNETIGYSIALNQGETIEDALVFLNETYDDQIATFGRALQDANDRVQKDYGTAQDYSPLLSTDPSIYTQDPEASQMASVNYLATQDPSDSSPSIWMQALKDAGAEAISGIDIPGIVSGFFNSKKSNTNAQQSIDDYVNYF